MDPTSTTRTHDPRHGLQILLLVDGLLRLFIWSCPITLTAAVFTACDAWPTQHYIGADFATAWLVTRKLTHMVLLYNVFYVLLLVLIRLLIPTPQEGIYEVGAGKRTSRQLLYAAVISTLTKARYEAPFPGFLVFHIASLPPMRWLMNPIFGPRSQSASITDPHILDPYGVRIGRNVVIGFGTTLAAHLQERGAIQIKKTIIEDDVLIGGHCAVTGAHVKRGAVVGAGSIVLPGSVIGEGEYWSGNPARRRPRPGTA